MRRGCAGKTLLTMGNLSKDLKGVRSFLKGARQAVERAVQVE